MPTVLRVRGYRFFFFSNEGSEPAHIHVQSGENYAKYWLRPIVLVESIGFDARELRRLQEIIATHQEMLERSWNDFFNLGQSGQ
jgi:hypothetical protein